MNGTVINRWTSYNGSLEPRFNQINLKFTLFRLLNPQATLTEMWILKIEI